MVGYLCGMETPLDPLYAGHRYPAEVICYAVWLYFRFPLSLRMPAEVKGIDLNQRQSGSQR